MLGKKYIVSLGYFDGVHVGHREVISKGVILAKQMSATPIVVSFNGNLRKAITGEGDFIYSKEEKKKIIATLGVKNVICLPISKKFLSKTKKEFLDYLNKRFKILGYTFGEDYRFGKNGEGDCNYLIEYAKTHNQIAESVQLKWENNKKISSTEIKEMLSNGKIKEANRLLYCNYLIMGKVVSDRGIGTKIGYPTANIEVDADRVKLKYGVYFGYTIIDRKRYSCLINAGVRPTFNLKKYSVEVHIIGLKQNLNGRNLTVYFTSFYREEKKFDNIEQLKWQIECDKKALLEGK